MDEIEKEILETMNHLYSVDVSEQIAIEHLRSVSDKIIGLYRIKEPVFVKKLVSDIDELWENYENHTINYQESDESSFRREINVGKLQFTSRRAIKTALCETFSQYLAEFGVLT